MTFDDVVTGLMRRHGVTRGDAERAAVRMGYAPGAGVVAPEVDEDALEKAIEHEGDKIMGGLGFEIVRFSHPGPTKQTPGIPDRRYYRRPRLVEHSDGRFLVRGYSLWWEAKSATGHQRPDQKLFQEMVEACGETYLLGTHEALLAWLTLERIAEQRDGVLELVEARP